MLIPHCGIVLYLEYEHKAVVLQGPGRQDRRGGHRFRSKRDAAKGEL